MFSRQQFVVFCLICGVSLRAVAADTPPAASNSWSFKFKDLTLFNIPTWGQSLFGATESPYTFERRVHAEVKALVKHDDIDPNIIEDSKLKTPDLIKKYGFPAEIHNVTTEDGYILEMHRIARPGAIPVLLCHGLLDTSATWVMMGPNKGLAYLLYDMGYDVWMTNMRGNTYSHRHVKYNTHHAVFWDFTFHEMGKYDLPASIDHVLNTTGHARLHYIGHSQGTMTFWIMCSERPEYSDKVMLMQALAPVAFIENCKSPVVKFLAFFQESLAILLRLIGAHEFLPNNEFITMFNQFVCDDDTLTKEICSNVIFLITGFDKAQANETMLPVVLGHAPGGASTKQMQHYGQLKKSGHFRQYDYGWLRNHWRYDSVTPPEYDFQRVRSKVALHYSANDWLATPKDVEHLYEKLPNVVGKFLVDFPEFNHLDFVWGIDAKELLYDRVLQLMRQVEQQQL